MAVSMLKKICLILIILFFTNSAFATCSLTGGACRIDDIIVKNKKEASSTKKDVYNKKKFKFKDEKPKKYLFKNTPQQKNDR